MDNQYLTILTSIISLASAIAAVTPTPKDGSTIAKIYRIIDFCALNIGRAKEHG